MEQKMYKIHRKKERLEFEIAQMEKMKRQQQKHLEIIDASKKSVTELQDGKFEMNEARALVCSFDNIITLLWLKNNCILFSYDFFEFSNLIP